jgi:hypothetical protein
VAPAIGIVIGISLFIGSCLQVFGFASGISLLVSLLLSLLDHGRPLGSAGAADGPGGRHFQGGRFR